ncbi:zinc ribbon domain-containing protein [Photobacterium sp. 1_MG-2023]|uniref:zinc ribbon domain-containing protein n=1 Tax=Photobacterium sp. 1_MG-2023 TaxID=3062646 RepID=UPI0026E3756A|nr:zinc ribbon domain-containing protein [Photobacterium sp. 1_MG-2023]MDO6704630.1 zinc ribbon domain-containing protein [Photobacterium sp. 1_MG-2023]
MSQSFCPACQLPLLWQLGGYYCAHCQNKFVKEAFCEDCGHLLERLNACGADNYFCPHCNVLKSKSRARITFRIAAADSQKNSGNPSSSA